MSIQIQFFGAAGTVTGSCSTVTCGSKRILIDCGVAQDKDCTKKKPFAFDPKTIDAVILTHAHLDHCGLVPVLFQQGYNGPVIAHYATGELAPILWQDTLSINAYDNCQLYDSAAFQKAVKSITYYDYDEPFNIDDIKITLYDAGHILGSSHVEIEYDGKRVLFSGDIGPKNTPIINEPNFTWRNPFDLVVIESTYGNRTHKSRIDTINEFKDLVRDTIKNRGVLLIPAFAIGRTQEVIYHLNSLVESGEIPPIPVLIDSPMANKVTGIYRKYTVCYDDETVEQIEGGDKPLDFRGLHHVKSFDESRSLAQLRPPFIIVAGSGMCNSGRIVQHIKNFIRSESTTIMIVGWQGKGTLGRKLADGSKRVKIDGEYYTVSARIATLNGFSAHADQRELLEWAKAIPRRNTMWIVNHGERDASSHLASLIMNAGLGEAKGAVKGGKFEIRNKKKEISW
jgi:metallo-beta-lactamase family protein